MSFSSPEPDALEKFLESVLEHQQKESTGQSEAKPSLDPDTLRELAAKYGLAGDAYDQLVKEAEEHRTRGLLFFEHRNWSDSVLELAQAYVILPYDSELALALGKAHARKWQENSLEPDHVRAEVLFRQCLKGNPNHAEAARELSDLKRLSKQKAGRLSSRAPILVGVLLIVSAILYFFSRPKQDDVAATPEVAVTPESPIPADKPAPAPALGPVPVPVTFPTSDNAGDFRFDERSSVLTRYEGKYSYLLLGTLSTGPVSISNARAKLELIGVDKNVLAEHEFDIVPTHRSRTVPGDSIPFRALLFHEQAAPEIVEARITLPLLQQTPFPGEPGSGKLLELTEGTTGLPADYGLELRERNAVQSKGPLGNEDKALLKLVLTLKNTGKRPIESLKLQATVTGRDGEIIAAGHSSITRHFADKMPPGQITAVSSIHAALLPGERRVVEASIYLPDTSPEDIGGYQLEIREIE